MARRLIIAPTNNQSGGFGPNQLVRFEVAAGPFAIDTSFTPSLTFVMELSMGAPVTGFMSPSIGIGSFIEQISVSSRMVDAGFSLVHHFSQCEMARGMAEGPRAQQTAAHLTKKSFDYASLSAVAVNYGTTLYGGGLKVNVALPLSSVDLFTSPDMTGKPTSALGGLNIDITLSPASNVFFDTANAATFTLHDINLHLLMKPVPMASAGAAAAPLFMRTIDARSDVIQLATETRSYALNMTAGEALVLFALPSAVANSYAGDSNVAQRLAATSADHTENMSVQGDALLSFMESTNGVQAPIANILSERTPAKQSEVVLVELLKALQLIGRPRLCGGQNAYNYEANFESAGAVASRSYLPKLTALADGVGPIPMFAIGYLFRVGGAALTSSSTTYTINSSIGSEKFISYALGRSVRKIETVTRGAETRLAVVA